MTEQANGQDNAGAQAMPDKPHDDATQPNTAKATRLRPYDARIRFVAIQDDAVRLFHAGYSLRAAWRTLTRQNGLTISYGAFRQNALTLLAAHDLPGGKAKGDPAQKLSAPDAPGAGSDRPPTRNRSEDRPRFHYDPADARREDLI